MPERCVVVRGRFRRVLYRGGRDFIVRPDGSLWVLDEQTQEMMRWSPLVVRGFSVWAWRTVEWEYVGDTWADRVWRGVARVVRWFTR